ncbi:MAG: hypothetical protein AB8F94_06255 [Saprospiraceae bacterium]
MKNLSLWAKNNRTKALAITILLHIVLGYFYFYIGAFLFLQKIVLPSILLYVSGILFLIAYTFYPIRYVQKGIYKRTFFKEKQWQLVAMVSAIIFLVFIGNQSTRSAFSQQNFSQAYSAQTIALDIKKEAKVENQKTRKLIRKAKRQLRKRIKRNVRKMRRAERGMTDFGKFVAIFFSVLAAIGLGLLVLGISCNLSCSGNEALAAIVLIGGFILIIGGLITIIRKIVLAKSRGEVEREKKEKESLG